MVPILSPKCKLLLRFPIYLCPPHLLFIHFVAFCSILYLRVLLRPVSTSQKVVFYVSRVGNDRVGTWPGGKSPGGNFPGRNRRVGNRLIPFDHVSPTEPNLYASARYFCRRSCVLELQGRIQDFWKGGGGSRRGYKIFHKHPPPLDIARVTSSTGSATCILGLRAKKGGGSNFGPNVKKPTSWPKRGGSGPPGPPRIRHWTRSPSAYLHNRAGRWNNR